MKLVLGLTVVRNKSFLLLLLTLISLGVDAASSSSPFNITIGSTISTSPNHTSYWHSTSTNFAFGFYPLSKNHHHQQQYIIGIWIATTCRNTLVWSLNSNGRPFSSSNLSIVFDQDGFFKFQDGIGRPQRKLFRNMVRSSASAASMHDNGNFVLYNSNSQIIWQSFDYPTHTILPGQILNSGYSLTSKNKNAEHLSGHYYLTMGQDSNLVTYHDYMDLSHQKYVFFRESNSNKQVDHVALKLNLNGNLDLVSRSNLVVKSLYLGQEQTNNGSSSSSLIIYRGTLDLDEIFRLYRENIGCQNGLPPVHWKTSVVGVSYFAFGSIIFLLMFPFIYIFATVALISLLRRRGQVINPV